MYVHNISILDLQLCSVSLCMHYPPPPLLSFGAFGLFKDNSIHILYTFISRLCFSKDSCVDCVLASDQALHEALMRQEELLAYIDRQEEAKLRVG
jgi:hypothetical protein